VFGECRPGVRAGKVLAGNPLPALSKYNE
jgi:hypothetical protein